MNCSSFRAGVTITYVNGRSRFRTHLHVSEPKPRLKLVSEL